MKSILVLLATAVAVTSAQTAPACDVAKFINILNSNDGALCVKDVPSFSAITGVPPDAEVGTKICASTGCKNVMNILKEHGDCTLSSGKTLSELLVNVPCASIKPLEANVTTAPAPIPVHDIKPTPDPKVQPKHSAASVFTTSCSAIVAMAIAAFMYT